MYHQYGMSDQEKQTHRELSLHAAELLQQFLSPLFLHLDTFLDKWLVQTFLATIFALILFRDRAKRLVLSV